MLPEIAVVIPKPTVDLCDGVVTVIQELVAMLLVLVVRHAPGEKVSHKFGVIKTAIHHSPFSLRMRLMSSIGGLMGLTGAVPRVQMRAIDLIVKAVLHS